MPCRIVVFVVGRSKGKINNIKDMTDMNKVKDVLNDLGNDTSSSTVNTNTKGIAEEVRQSDPEFSEEKFLSWFLIVILLRRPKTAQRRP